jgi:hypothetical protein
MHCKYCFAESPNTYSRCIQCGKEFIESTPDSTVSQSHSVRRINTLFPSVKTVEEAISIAKQGAYAACLSSILTAGFAFYSIFTGLTFGLITPNAFFDAVIFADIAFGIRRMSRFAALFGLTFYWWEQWGRVKPSTTAIIYGINPVLR